MAGSVLSRSSTNFLPLCEQYRLSLNLFLEQLRTEIYIQPYSSINFKDQRNNVAPTDLKRSPNAPLKVMNSMLSFWESYLQPKWIHEKSNTAVLSVIRCEDENTSYNDLAPVNKAFHMVAVNLSGNKEATARHAEKLSTYLWLREKGMTSWRHKWKAGLGKRPEFRLMLEKALQFLDI
ncbi:MAG: hypothetical protein LQ340_001841 [Diploschistes diacapsis]|nr:MAG: hypothetical protein LQ340_001841 [Diploschistes diacapsis]